MAGPGWGGVARPWVIRSSSSQASASSVAAEDDDGVVDLTKDELPAPPLFALRPSQRALDAIADLAAPLAPAEPPRADAAIAGNDAAARPARTSTPRRLPPTLSSPAPAVAGSKRTAPNDGSVGAASASAPPPPPAVKAEPLTVQPPQARPQHQPEPAERAPGSRQGKAGDQRSAGDARAAPPQPQPQQQQQRAQPQPPRATPPPPQQQQQQRAQPQPRQQQQQQRPQPQPTPKLTPKPSDGRPPLTAAQRELISQVQLVLTTTPTSVIEKLVRTQLPELQTVEGLITHLLDGDHADVMAVPPPPAAAAAGSAAAANRPVAPSTAPVVIDADASPGPAKRARTDPTSDVVRVGRGAPGAVAVSIMRSHVPHTLLASVLEGLI